jgi:glycine dehydrogenase
MDPVDSTFDPELFSTRHLGSNEAEVSEMLSQLDYASLDALVAAVIPESIHFAGRLELPPVLGEYDCIDRLREIAADNVVSRSFIGMGYYDTIVPPVIQRNILENPGWYTQYTPYQAEISQGRMEALVNFQTMVSELTALPLANASLLDEATAAAEAMSMCLAVKRGGGNRFFVDHRCHPQTRRVVQTRAAAIGMECEVGALDSIDYGTENDLVGVLVQYPDSDGGIEDYSNLCQQAHEANALVVVATDLLALTLLKPPGEFGADIAVGSTQRFGVPLGFGGPHAAFLATTDKYKRQVPGRIIGISRDSKGKPAYRLALQTREQHIRRDRATSNICTAQVLLAIMASFYGLYHGPVGLRRIAFRVHRLTQLLADGLVRLGYKLKAENYFDTLRVGVEANAVIFEAAQAKGFDLARHDNGDLGISLDERSTCEEVAELLALFAKDGASPSTTAELAIASDAPTAIPQKLARKTGFMQQEVFSRYQTEHEMLRYIHRLQARDLSLTTSMIPLGSCTMKLNGTSEMVPVSWPEFGGLHPFAPPSRWRGYRTLIDELGAWLAEITGMAAVSFQPNAGSQGEYAGLLVIRAHQQAKGEEARNICLIPSSAHGTNPASAVMAGLKVVGVACNEQGDIDLEDLAKKVDEYSEQLSSIMITYPSTHGVFEEGVRQACELVHAAGGQVYLDGANLNAQVGLCRPGDFGADVIHLNLHKTFAIPHGGGGPGMGPIAVAEHLSPYLPGHPVVSVGGKDAIGAIAAAPFGSPSILPISWVYVATMGATGLKRASQVAILNANYMAHRLRDHFPIVYSGRNGRVAHEFIIDMRAFKKTAGISVDDVAKRLMDYGFHAPTMSWPVPGTMMIEPTESESKWELDRFCQAMVSIREEIRDVEEGRADREDNVLRNAPHTSEMVAADIWPHAYSRELAAFPTEWQRDHKYWPPVSRVDNAFGDRNLVCSCS